MTFEVVWEWEWKERAGWEEIKVYASQFGSVTVWHHEKTLKENK